MEKLSSLFLVVKRNACGLRIVEEMAAMLKFIFGKLTMPCYCTQ